MATSRGVDVSAFQGPQDWAAHKADGVVFAFAKASEGERSRDKRFDEHMTGIVKAGLVPGAYHFAWPTQDPAAEADNYIAAVKPYGSHHLVHLLDLERYSDGRNYAGQTDAQIKAWAASWVAAVKRAFPGQRVGVYTSGDDIAKGHVPSNSDALWYPRYPGASVNSYPEAEKASRPKPSGHEVLFWQFVGSPLDRSLCYMSAADLRTWAGGASKPAPAPAPKPTPRATVDLSKLVAAAKSNPSAKGTPVTYSGVKTVEKALVAEGLLAASLADGHYGTATRTAYAKWQRRCGFTSPSAADGIPGKTTLTKLGAKHGFSVVA